MILEQHTQLDSYSTSSEKQSTGRHVDPLKIYDGPWCHYDAFRFESKK